MAEISTPVPSASATPVLREAGLATQSPLGERETSPRRVAHQSVVVSALLRVARFLLRRSGSTGPMGNKLAAVFRIKALRRLHLLRVARFLLGRSGSTGLVSNSPVAMRR